MVNKKGQVLGYTIMLSILVLFTALALAGSVKTTVDNARNTTTPDGADGLDCTNTSISTYNKATCIVADLTIFHFIGGLIAIAGAIAAAKVIFS